MLRNTHYDVLIIGASSAGISVAARLARQSGRSIGLLEPAKMHYYQPPWTLVGGGRARPCPPVKQARLAQTSDPPT